MNNRERVTEAKEYGMFIALRRKKENNRELKELCFRQIIRDREIDLAILRAKVERIPGIWRIYEQINKRRVEPARKLLMKYLIDEPEKFEWRIDSLWKNCLLKSCCKSERNFLIDIDDNWSIIEVYDFATNRNIDVDEVIKTPNGWHLICHKLDTRVLQGLDNIEVKRDACKFVERFEIK